MNTIAMLTGYTVLLVCGVFFCVVAIECLLSGLARVFARPTMESIFDEEIARRETLKRRAPVIHRWVYETLARNERHHLIAITADQPMDAWKELMRTAE